MGSRRRGSLRDAFGGDTPRHSDPATGDTVNTANSAADAGDVEMVPGGRSGEMVPADKPVNMTFTVTAKERYLWTLELRRRGRSAVSVLRERMNELTDEG